MIHIWKIFPAHKPCRELPRNHPDLLKCHLSITKMELLSEELSCKSLAQVSVH